MSVLTHVDRVPVQRVAEKGVAALVVPGLVSASLAVLIITFIRAWWQGDSVGAYLGEHTFPTYYVGGLLLLTGAASLGLSVRHLLTDGDARARLSIAIVWAFLGITFLVMAGDEVLELHERLDRKVHRVFSITETSLTDRLDDIIVASYGAFILLVLFPLRRTLERYQQLWRLFWLVVGLCVLTVILDIASNDFVWLHRIFSDEFLATLFYDLRVTEEAVKVITAGLLFALVLLCVDTDAHSTLRRTA